ncbi:uncharacterized protein LOC119176273 [Rhipicephalus microplus]|uniref:uncharacterized protein LOC119176273 n=1 Tax=Rhipicephalus microplus TaxID=6941 RepID=UPI003F6B7775
MMDSEAQRILLSLIQHQAPSSTEDAVLRTNMAGDVPRRGSEEMRMELRLPCVETGGDGTDTLHLPAPTASRSADGETGAQSKPSGPRRGGGGKYINTECLQLPQQVFLGKSNKHASERVKVYL